MRVQIEAKHRGIKTSELLMLALQQYLNLSEGKPKQVLDDPIRRLAGTWTEEEARLFEENTREFGQIDQELW